MDFRSLKYAAVACGGELVGGDSDAAIRRVSTDSRQVRAGDLFFALAGDRFDGHNFLKEAAGKGIAAAVVARGRAPAGLGCGLIVVDDPRRALGNLASRYRADFSLPTIAVAGSNGKTTTKELIASVLRQKRETLWSEASFNNDVGVPVTLLNLEARHRAAVVEVGSNHPGELAPLVRMVQPDLGVVTSIGREHLEFFGDLAGVAREEGWLAELLPVGGTLFLGGDSEWSAPIAGRTRAKVALAGFGPVNDWRATRVRPDAAGSTFFVEAREAEFGGEYRVNLVGRHHVVNALFAVAVGAKLGLTLAEIQLGLAACQPAKMRSQLWDWRGVRVLDDAYNANADSMAAALETLRDMPCAGRRVAVLGDMAELGAHSRAAHEEVGRRAVRARVDQLFAVGAMAGILAGAARAAGLKAVAEFSEVGAAAEAVRRFLRPGDTLLLKASRSMRFERLSEALRAADAAERV